MKKLTMLASALLLALLVAPVLYAQHSHPTPAKPKKLSDAEKIANAMAAAPAEIAKHATILDWPAKEGEKPRELRKGTNDWVCFPNSPEEYGGASVDDPMCMDKEWQSWGEAWQGHKTPHTTGTGIAYMLKGDKGASNTDPYATGPTKDNHWVTSPPHVMVLPSDPKMLDAYPTDPKNGGPWVMWKGTPYAHLMVPVSTTKTASMK